MRFILLETAMGYLLFERKESDEIGATLPEVQGAAKDYGKFSLVLKLPASGSAPLCCQLSPTSSLCMMKERHFELCPAPPRSRCSAAKHSVLSCR